MIGMQLTKFTSAIALAVAATAALATGAIADPIPSSASVSGLESLPDTTNRAGYANSGDFYRNNTILRQGAFILGPPSSFSERGSFPENEIEQDAKLLEIVYRDALYQQTQTDPYLRTPDLPNPFGTSLIQQPGYSNRLMTSSPSPIPMGSFVLERPPMP